MAKKTVRDSMKATPTTPAAEPRGDGAEPSFEAQLGALDAIVRRLESGDLGLDDSIGAFESGVALVKRLQERLTAAEARVRWLVAEVESADEAGPDGGRAAPSMPGPSERRPDRGPA
jgi:exodeoxyribonuclease VII small subunit